MRGFGADYASASRRGQADMLAVCASKACPGGRGGNMSIIAKVLVALVALEHIYFLVLEMFLWTKPRTRAAFGMSAEQAEQSKVLAANQGLYNGFLAAGLIWALIAPAAYAAP